MENTPLFILKKYWGYLSFRQNQEAIINSLLNRQDTLAVLPTGAGKSLCYQIPAMLQPGICLVISPLIALMKDQVDALNSKGIKAVMLSGNMNFYEIERTIANAINGDFKFIYLSPERIQTPAFEAMIADAQISIIAIDEAHCISQWGYDFRPSYLKIIKLRQWFPKSPILAVTASATNKIKEDIVEKLALKNCSFFTQNFIRSNLSYSCFSTDNKFVKLKNILQKVDGSAIVYCSTRFEAQKVAQQLNQYQINADFYHAGLSFEVRNTKQKAWKTNACRVMVSTNAFGMGIDKNDVRLVVHFSVPDCLENYYQEVGRAGRDEQKAYAVLLWRAEDFVRLEKNMELKYPPMVLIKKVYQDIANYLQIPAGTGEYTYYLFNIEKFCNAFKHEPLQVINILKLLEQEGHLLLNEQNFIPTQIQVIADKDMLSNVGKLYPDLENTLQALLRNYAHILDVPVKIKEEQLSKFLNINAAILHQQLQQLQQLGIISYQPKSEEASIFYILNRAVVDHLFIDTNNLLKRKALQQQRLAAIKDYVGNNSTCRSVLLANYFNAVCEPCGVCDNCLAKRKKELTEDEFEKIRQYCLTNIATGVKELTVLLHQCKQFSENKLLKVIKILQEEEKIKIDALGNIELVG